MAFGASKMIRTCFYIGSPLVSVSQLTFELSHIFYRMVTQLHYIPREFMIILGRFQTLILRSGILVAVASFSTGVLMTLQFSVGVSRFGGRLYVPTLVAMSMMKALGPMLAALMVAARSGGGLAAEIAGMSISQQTDAIQALGSSVDRKLIMPNIIALIVGLPCLAMLSIFAGLVGGGIGAVANLGLPPTLIIQKMSGTINQTDLWSGVLKTAPQGLIVGLVACHFGLRARGGTAGVGKATTATIMAATLLVLLSDLILTKLMWLIL